MVSPFPNSEEQGLPFVWRLPFVLYSLDNPSKSLRHTSLTVRKTSACKPPHHLQIISQGKDTLLATFKNVINVVTHLEDRCKLWFGVRTIV
jgi:hypothetical protein